MSAPDPDPAKRPLFVPDPVIEYYIERVDRPAIRERLRMTPEERLAELQREVDACCEQKAALVREEPPNKPAPPLKFCGEEFQPPPPTTPMLFPDPVIAAYMKDVDRTILRENLRLSVAQRLENFAGFMQDVYELRGVSYKPSDLWEEHLPSHAGTTSEN